ncbi:SRPBCC family protein [Kribbella sp. WER1]
MASISKEIHLRTGADDAWRVIGDFHTGPERMAPGLVLDSRIAGDYRLVTFADGTVARERLVAVDDTARRIVYSVVGDHIQPEHNNASMQIITDGDDGCRLVWIHDVLPDPTDAA